MRINARVPQPTIYTIVSGAWTDMPEAKPRARARVKDGYGNARVTVSLDGELEYDDNAGIEIDRYEDPKYEDVRNEVR